MTDYAQGAATVLARAVSAEIRAVLAARRISQRDLAAEAGFASHNYIAIRLRDEKPLTLDDVDRICAYFEEDPVPFLTRAWKNHSERLWAESLTISRTQLEPREAGTPQPRPRRP